MRSVEQCGGEGGASRSPLEVKIERRTYGRGEYAAASNVSGLC